MPGFKNQQLIDFDKSDENVPTFIRSRDVMVHPSSTTRELDSSSNRYTPGHLISYHALSKNVAYVISVTDNYMIRVLNEQNSSRCLIKDFEAEIKDIEFSNSKIPYIASVDINGTVKVFKIIADAETLSFQLIIHIKVNPLDSPITPKICYNRVVWCPRNDSDDCVAEEAEIAGTNISLLLGIAHGDMVEIIQVDTIESEFSSRGQPYDGRVDREELQLISKDFQNQYKGSVSLADLFLPYIRFTSPSDAGQVTTVAISGDAAAFAVALQDGSVHFFTLDGRTASGLNEVYSWRPFEGDTVWSLLFLDDCRPGSHTDSFWQHVVVGGAYNRQLKMFRCDKWDCVQTVTFHAPSSPCLLSAHIDLSGRFLFLSDLRRKALFLLEIDSIDGGATKLFKSVQEFILTQPLLSFDVDSIDCTIASNGSQQVVLKLYTITNTAFQKMRVTYMSRGHRMAEIGLSGDVPTTDDGRHSALTQVSMLLSPGSSYQDPAIISTKMHDFSAPIDSGASPVDVPANLKHLFSNLSSAHTEPLANDSPGRHEFSHFEDLKLSSQLKHQMSLDTGNGDHIKDVMSRFETMMEMQKRDIDNLAHSVQEMKKEVLTHRAEMKNVWSAERGVKDIGDSCQKTLATRLGPFVKDAVDAVAPKLSGDISTRLANQVKDHIAAVEPVMRDFTNGLLHEKAFVGHLSAAMADALERPLRAAYVDMVRKELAPSFSKAVDKVISETRDLLKNGMSELNVLVEDNHKRGTRVAEENLTRVLSCQQKATMGDLERHMHRMTKEMTEGLNAATEAARQASTRTEKLHDVIISIKEVLAARADAVTNNDSSFMSRGESVMNVSACGAETTASREQRIMSLLADKDFVGAMNEVLSLTNMRVLLLVCARVPPATVLSGNPQKPSGLPPCSILALVQQLARDFQEAPDLKAAFLVDAVLSLDCEAAAVRDHVPRVLRGAARRLQGHIDQGGAASGRLTMLLRLVLSRLEGRV